VTKLTFRKNRDTVFTPDDRDSVVQQLPEDQRLPKYGANSLHRPPRPFREAEAAAADRIGMPKPSKQD
jgi:hypothetical protein